MSWKVTWPMKERTNLVSWYETGHYTVTELAAQFGVSRKTAHKWLGRFAAEGQEGLGDRSRAPRHHPNAASPAVVAAVVRAKLAHPTWGPLKLSPGSQEPSEVVQAWPSPSTRGVILTRHGLTGTRRRRRRVPPSTQPFAAADRPNAVWCADFKGWFRTGDGRRCDPLTISDAYSRMFLCCHGLPRPDYAHVRPAFEATFRAYGLPEVIRTDNGPPFASVAAGGLTPLSVWWVKLGITPERIEPGHPEQNGRHERLHGTLKRECLQPPAATMEQQQGCFDVFRDVYNHQRPHQALGQRPPVTSYQPSPRRYPDRLEDVLYSDDTNVRRVRSNGQIKWRGTLVFISEALVGELVHLRESAAGWIVHFGPIPLGLLDPIGERLQRLPMPHTTAAQRASPESGSVTYVPR